jgi:hypothetical protein
VDKKSGAGSEIDRAQVLVNECFQQIMGYDDKQAPDMILPVFDLCITSLKTLVTYEDTGQFTAEPSAKEMLVKMEREKDSVYFSVVNNIVSDFWQKLVPEGREGRINQFNDLLLQVQDIKKHVKNPKDIERVETALSLGIKKLSFCPDEQELLLFYKDIISSLN